MHQDFKQNKLPQNLWKFIWNFLKPYQIISIIYILISAAAGLMGPINSMLLKHIIDAISRSQDQNVSVIFWPSLLLVFNFIVLDNFT